METTLDTEAVLSSLKELAAERHQKIPQILEDYLLQVAKTGNVVFENEWPDVKRLLKLKLDCNIDYFQHFCSDLPTDKDFSLHQSRTFLYDRFDFFSRPPFTIQRLVEVLTTSRRQYRRIDKYLRAVEKNLMVVSTIGQEAEFTCEAKYVPHFNYSSPTVSKVGQADLIPLQNAAMDFEVRSRLSMRIFNPALNTMNGDESDDEEEDEEMEDDSEVPFIHPALDGAPGESMEGGTTGNDSPGRKNLLRKRKLRHSPEQSSSTAVTNSTEPESTAMETNASEDTMNGNEAKETETPTANAEESEKPAQEEESKPIPEVSPEEKVENQELPKPEVTETEPPKDEEMNVDKESEEKEESEEVEQMKTEVEDEKPVEEESKADITSDLVKPVEEAKDQKEEEDTEKVTMISSATEEEIIEKPVVEKSEGAEKEVSADSEISTS